MNSAATLSKVVSHAVESEQPDVTIDNTELIGTEITDEHPQLPKEIILFILNINHDFFENLISIISTFLYRSDHDSFSLLQLKYLMKLIKNKIIKFNYDNLKEIFDNLRDEHVRKIKCLNERNIILRENPFSNTNEYKMLLNVREIYREDHIINMINIDFDTLYCKNQELHDMKMFIEILITNKILYK